MWYLYFSVNTSLSMIISKCKTGFSLCFPEDCAGQFIDDLHYSCLSAVYAASFFLILLLERLSPTSLTAKHSSVCLGAYGIESDLACVADPTWSLIPIFTPQQITFSNNSPICGTYVICVSFRDSPHCQEPLCPTVHEGACGLISEGPWTSWNMHTWMNFSRGICFTPL